MRAKKNLYFTLWVIVIHLQAIYFAILIIKRIDFAHIYINLSVVGLRVIFSVLHILVLKILEINVLVVLMIM
jgi:hypothetical protein